VGITKRRYGKFESESVHAVTFAEKLFFAIIYNRKRG
jgi:hypothetical protein